MNESRPSELPAVAASPCVLVVEDEMLVAMMLEEMLKDLGYRVIKAARLAKAASLAATEPIAFAILDVNLAGMASYPVAEELRRRGIPFVFATGYAPGSLRAEFQDCPVLRKPYMARQVQQALAMVFGSKVPAG
jgi:CheY-like chemotaxis protein